MSRRKRIEILLYSFAFCLLVFFSPPELRSQLHTHCWHKTILSFFFPEIAFCYRTEKEMIQFYICFIHSSSRLLLKLSLQKHSHLKLTSEILFSEVICALATGISLDIQLIAKKAGFLFTSMETFRKHWLLKKKKRQKTHTCPFFHMSYSL